MDAKAKNKALFRARLNAQKKEKRINSHLAHQLSQKHKEAVANLKATASGVNQVKNATTEAHPELELEDPKPERALELLRPQTSSGLPPFFKTSQKMKYRMDSHTSVETDSYKKMPNRSNEPFRDLTQEASQIATSQATQVKGALPEWFFDSKEADLSARGIKLVKPDVKDEYKEFEKLIQEDLKEIDNRLEKKRR